MALYYCDDCKTAFLPEATTTDGDRLFCKKCNQALINLGAEDGRVSLQGHIQSKDHIGSKDLYNSVSLIKSKHYAMPKKDPILMDCEYKLKLNPLNTSALFTLSQWYFSQGLVDEAHAIAQQIIQINPNHHGAHDFISQQHITHHISSDALPSDQKTLEDMAINFFNTNQLSKAEVPLKKLLSMNPKHSAARRYLVEIYTKNNQFNEAIYHLNRLAMQFPDDEHILFNLAVASYHANDHPRAISNLKAAHKACRDPELLKNIQVFMDHINNNAPN